MKEKRILTLTLKKQWYDMIERRHKPKKEEYRDIKPFFNSRLEGKHYDEVEFINGYHPDARRMRLRILEIVKDFGKLEYGGNPKVKYWVIRLGKKLWSKG